MKKKSIAFIFPYNTWGGAFRSTFILSNNLVERGWDVDIIFPIIPPRNGFKPLTLKWFLNKLKGICRSLIRRKKINLEHKFNVLLIPWISSIWIRRDYSFLVANHWNTVEDIYNLPTINTTKYHYVRDIDNFDHHFLQSLGAFKIPIKKIVVAKWIASYLKENLDIDVEAIITNGTDVNPFLLKKHKPNNNKLCIGMCCGEHGSKGTKFGLLGIKKAFNSIPDIKILLFGYKKPKEDYDLEYEWVQAPSGESLREVYRKIHIFISPSLQEGFHNPPREAMAARCALIATNVGCIPDIGIDNENMIKVKIKDSEAISNAIMRLVNNIELREKIALAGEQRIKKEDWSSRVDSFEELLIGKK